MLFEISTRRPARQRLLSFASAGQTYADRHQAVAAGGDCVARKNHHLAEAQFGFILLYNVGALHDILLWAVIATSKRYEQAC